MELPKTKEFDQISEFTERSLKIKKILEKQTMVKPAVISVAIPLPPPTTIGHMELSLTMNGVEENILSSEGNNNDMAKKSTGGVNHIHTTCLHHHDNNHNEEEVLTLQVLSARSSTPYTQPMSCTAASCDLENVSEHVSPVKDDGGNTDKQNAREMRENLKAKKIPMITSKSVSLMSSTNDDCDGKTLCESKSGVHHSLVDESIIHYSRENLFTIRNEMPSIKSKQQSFSPHTPPNIVNCDVIELEARLKRFNILKKLITDAEGTRNNNNLKPRCNDMMPSFVKRKFMDESIISSQPPQPLEFKVSIILFKCF